MRFRKMVDAAPVMIWISDARKRASFVNRSWLDFTGRSLDQELGFGWLDAVYADHREEAVARYSSTFDDRRVWEEECQLQRRDGEYYAGALLVTQARVFLRGTSFPLPTLRS
jgi:PAS domain S-box-containing protein